jgi:hypothetical protein
VHHSPGQVGTTSSSSAAALNDAALALLADPLASPVVALAAVERATTSPSMYRQRAGGLGAHGPDQECRSWLLPQCAEVYLTACRLLVPDGAALLCR